MNFYLFSQIILYAHHEADTEADKVATHIMACFAPFSRAPWVRKIGKPSGREYLVMTSPYEQTSFVRPSIRTDYWGGEGLLVVTLTVEPK